MTPPLPVAVIDQILADIERRVGRQASAFRLRAELWRRRVSANPGDAAGVRLEREPLHSSRRSLNLAAGLGLGGNEY